MPLGHTLEQPFAALYGWTAKHLSDFEEAQQNCGGQAGRPAFARAGRVGPDCGAT
jgi:hypothetical protein